MKRVLVIYNRQSGGETKLSDLKKACAAHKLAASFVALSPKIDKQVTAAKEQGIKIIVAAGGDGTVSSVAAVAKQYNLTLGVLPTGTFNHFAKDIGLPLALDEAVQVLARGHSKSIDIATVNGQVFINNSSIGLYPATVKQRERLAGLFGKWPAAVIGLARALVKMRRYRVTLTVGNKQLQRKTPFIFVGNNIYHLGTIGITDRKRLDGGKLCVYVVTTASVARLVRIFLRALLGRIKIEQDFESFTAKKLTITTKRPQLAVSRDGEVSVLESPLQYQIEPAALRLLVP